MDQFFTLYETPDETHKLYVVESVEAETSRALYSEEAARREYPRILDELLNQAKVNEHLGL